MALEIEGRIARKLNVQTGTSARGAWSKQEFILEYQEGNFPSQICMNVWGEDKVRDLDKYQVGDKVKVSIRFRGREFGHPEIGKEIMERFAEYCSEVASVEKPAKMEGRNMLMFLAPKSSK